MFINKIIFQSIFRNTARRGEEEKFTKGGKKGDEALL